MQHWRHSIGTLLILTPIFLLMLARLFWVFLGSMGTDIHWASKTAAYATITFIALLISACVALGLRLRKAPRA